MSFDSVGDIGTGNAATGALDANGTGDTVAYGLANPTMGAAVTAVSVKKMMKPKKERRYKSIDPVIQKIKKYLGKYDTHAIRVDLARSVISGKAYKFSEYVEKNHGAKKLFGALGVAACLVLGSCSKLFKSVGYNYIILAHVSNSFCHIMNMEISF